MGVPASFLPPDEFDGYRVQRLVGRGAMGQVYLARDTVLERAVAVKFLASLAAGAIARERFLVEARAIARLQHPNVVAVHRVGEVDGRPYLVSEYVRGRSLDLLELPVPGPRLLELAIGLAAGLAAAHRRGVLHRDLKPANALLSDDGEVKLCDFGLAKLFTAGAEAGAGAGTGAGTVAGSMTPSSFAALRLARTVPTAPAPRPGDLDATPVLPDPDAALALAPKMAAGTPASPALAATDPDGSLPHPSDLPTPDLGLTRPGALVGTPLFMAPEIWRGEPATVRSDLFSLGAILYQLACGRTPYVAGTLDELREAVSAGSPRPLAEVAGRGSGAGVDAAFATIVDRLLDADASHRFASADELHAALADLAAPRVAPPPGNPYRGLRAFDAEHRALFFGRRAETAAIVERLRAEALVIVAGDSGVGKSSLCRAGVLPAVADAGLGDGRSYRVLRCVVGRRPLIELAHALASVVDDAVDDEARAEALASDPRALVRRLRARLGTAAGVLLYVDQLEELVTQSDGGPTRDAFAEALAELADRVPGVRVLASVRGDFLTRVAALPRLGPRLSEALFLLRPLGGPELRAAVVGPAASAGVRFETDALVDDLARAAETPGALPLLSFALAELWERRDAERRVIPAAALAAIGGVSGALARHGDGVLAALAPDERAAARRLLTQLVTTLGTRALRGEAELVGERDAAARAALAALVRARLLSVRPADDGTSLYEVAHEALLSGWGTLREWLDADAGRRAVRERLAVAAAEWERLAQARAALWGAPQLSEAARVQVAEADLAGRERSFVAASRRELGRRRWLRRGAVAVVPLAALAIWGGVVLQGRAERSRAVEARLAVARPEIAEAKRLEVETEQLRNSAFALFDKSAEDDAEAKWAQVVDLTGEVDARYARAAQALEAALQLDPGRSDVGASLADVLYERALLAERDSRGKQLAELLERLRLYDVKGGRLRRWSAPARLSLSSDFPVRVTALRYDNTARVRRLEPTSELGVTPIERELDPGSYLLTLTSPGGVSVRYPVLLTRGEHFTANVMIPERVPHGFVFVPPGRFLYGSRDDDALRQSFFHAQPQHRTQTGGYLIARHEVTYDEWIAFLETLPRVEREQTGPHTDDVDLKRTADGSWRLRLRPSLDVSYEVSQGERLRYRDRDRRVEHDWGRLPVTGISPDESMRYAAWLHGTARTPGARLCSEREWERAARGADERVFPHGNVLAADDADIDVTYGRRSPAFGPDEVGSHPASDSPFGVSDMAGNVWEFTRPDEPRAAIVMRGGSFYAASPSARSDNREPAEMGMRSRSVGFRICADLPAR